MKHLHFVAAAVLSLSTLGAMAAQPVSPEPKCPVMAGMAFYPGVYRLADGTDLEVIESRGRYFASTNHGRRFALVENEPGQLSAVRRDFRISFCARGDSLAYDVLINKRSADGSAVTAQAARRDDVPVQLAAGQPK
jgi:hypothetical protein